ncbi:unnamed protein product [Fusarium langsethiae]|nr:unnamed protein product [Fusarium langsethiae]
MIEIRKEHKRQQYSSLHYLSLTHYPSLTFPIIHLLSSLFLKTPPTFFQDLASQTAWLHIYKDEAIHLHTLGSDYGCYKCPSGRTREYVEYRYYERKNGGDWVLIPYDPRCPPEKPVHPKPVVTYHEPKPYHPEPKPKPHYYKPEPKPYHPKPYYPKPEHKPEPKPYHPKPYYPKPEHKPEPKPYHPKPYYPKPEHKPESKPKPHYPPPEHKPAAKPYPPPK